MESKLWLCRELEKCLRSSGAPPERSYDLILMGGWYGVLAQMISFRQQIEIRRCFNLDLDGRALEISLKVNDRWRFQNKFQTLKVDINQDLDLPDLQSDPDRQIWINCSTEHLNSHRWLKNIPAGAWVVVQGTDMPHAEHISGTADLAGFLKQFEESLSFEMTGSKDFAYGVFRFSRFMAIGRRKI